MSRMRVTAAQILADCPLVVGFGGWGVLGSELPATGEHGPSVGYQWIDPVADANKEIWVRITTEPSVGALLMWPDSSFEYDGPSTTFEAQLAVDAADVGTPQTVTVTVGAVTHEVTPVSASAQPTASTVSVQQGGQHAIVVGGALAQATAGSTTVSQTHRTSPASASAQPAAGSVSIYSGATPVFVSPTAAEAQPTASTASISQAYGISPQPALAAPTAQAITVSQTHSIALSSATAQPTASVVWLPLPDGFVPRVALGARLSVSALAARVQATALSGRLQ